MRRRSSGQATVWNLCLVMIIVTTAFGVVGFGRAAGDRVRREVTADTAALAAADLLADRLAHIARIQRLGLEGDKEKAKEASQLTQRLAAETEAIIRREVDRVARGNGASRSELRFPQGGWFEIVKEGETEWIALSPEFAKERIRVAIWQPTADGGDLEARSTSWVKCDEEIPQGPLTQDRWRGIRVAAEE